MGETMQVANPTPTLRFEGFTDPWEQRKLGELFQSGGSGGTPTASNPDYYGGGIPFLSIADIEERDISYTAKTLTDAGLQNSAAWIVPSGALSLAMYASVGKVGIIRQDTATSQAFYNMVFEDNSLRDYVFTRLEKACLDSEWEPYISTGTQRNLNADKVKSFNLAVPSEAEQRLIGSYFSRLDSLITLHQRKCERLRHLKAAMLDKMFPKPGEKYPELRFEGFTDPWEQRKLGSIAASFDYGLNAAATEYDGQNKYLRITDIDDVTHEFLKSDLTTPLADLAMSADYLLEEGDLLFARTGASVGKTYLYRQYDGTVFFAGFLIRARIGESADPEFVYQATLTDAYKKYVAITSQRSGQPGVNAQEYADYQLMLPSRTEQQQIGMTLRSLDNFITLHQRKCERLRHLKAAMLDKMFV